jgi:CHU_C Type IX secretion signal domain
MNLSKLFRFCTVTSYLLLFLNAETLACVDSFHIKVTPVQCHGLRNGLIRITQVFGGQSPYLYSLDGLSFSTNPVFDRLKSGDYQVFVKDQNGCVSALPASLLEPEPLIVKIVLQDSIVNVGDYVLLKAEIAPSDARLGVLDWRPDGLFQNDDSLFQSIRVRQDTTIIVEVNDKNHCVSRDLRRIYVEDALVYAPNVFNPRSDQNAWFTLFAGEGISRINSLQIYNRYGEQMFHRSNLYPNDPLSGWNGRDNGKFVQSGVYFWAAELFCFDGRIVKKTGAVAVVY